MTTGKVQKNQINGFILINKPKGITSFDVIRKLRKLLPTKKMGHMGTLDPNATGLLPVAVGKATRLSQFLLNSEKEYRACIRLGRSTTTYDADGETVGDVVDPPALTEEQISDHLKSFLGEIEQIPPMYSAKKVEGKRLYQYAREGQTVEPEACSVHIYDIQLLEYTKDYLEINVSCSSGMYVRSLAHDLGQKIGCGAFLEDLTRVRVGTLKLDQAFDLERLETMTSENDHSYLYPAHDLLPGFPKIELNDTQINRIKNGNHVILQNPTIKDREFVRLFDISGLMVAIGVVTKPFGSMQTQIHPKVVFH